MIDKLKNNYFMVAAILIGIVAFILRFYNYPSRWGLAYDQAHDAIVARYALENFLLPLVGPFASGAQFQTSGIWYWFLMTATAIYPDAIITPWVIITVCYFLFVFFMVLIGKELINKEFGLLVGLLTAISTGQITQSTNLSLTAPMCFVIALGIYSAIKFYKTKKIKFAFLIGLAAGLAPTIHLQGALFVIFVPVVMVLLKIRDLKTISIIILGGFIPTIPLIIFDLTHNFVNVSGLINHFFVKQYLVSYEVLGRRWITFLGIFWPSSWAHVIGGYPIIGYLIMFFVFITVLLESTKRRVNPIWLSLIVTFLFAVVGMRYIRTPLFDSYVVFLHPFILLLTAWMVWLIFSRSKYIGIIFLLTISLFTLHKDYVEITNASNYTTKLTHDMKKSLDAFGKGKYAIHDYQFKTNGYTLPLLMLLHRDNMLSDDGYNIGVFYSSNSAEFDFKPVYGGINSFQLVDLSSVTSSELEKMDWYHMSPKKIYDSTENWYDTINKE